jgi:hypothetical protein
VLGEEMLGVRAINERQLFGGAAETNEPGPTRQR